MTLVVLPEEEWNAFKQRQDQILVELSYLKQTKETIPVPSNQPAYLTAKEFMSAVHIKRTKFDTLVGVIKSRLKKGGGYIYQLQKSIAILVSRIP